ncbi:restriction endonuclease subunit S, partial [bacterium]|nr:restriction endonuclease subunit S [bacterium]
MKYPMKELSEVALINPKRPSIERDDEALTSFVPMEAVDDVRGIVNQDITQPFSKVKKGYTYFENGDVIFAKITPCMQNGKHAVVSNLIDGFGFGSTEFHVIRPFKEVTAEWIHYFLRQKGTLDSAVKTFTGSVGQQRVPQSFLENIEIPLPSIELQHQNTNRLKAQLDEVEKARHAAQVQLESISDLCEQGMEQAVRNSLKNTDERIHLGDVVSISAKLVNPTLQEYCRLPHVSAENIVSVTGEFIGLQSAADDGMKSNKYLFEAGDVLYSKLRPYLRKVALPDFAGLCSADMYPLKIDSDRINAGFLRILLTSKIFTEYANEKSARSRMPKLNREQLFNWEFNLPSLNHQQECVRKIE